MVVERRLLDRVLGELKFQQSGLVDEKTIKKIGKILGADYIVTGTLNDVESGKTEVNARIINAESAQVAGAGSIEVPKTWAETIPLPPMIGPIPEEAEGLVKTKNYMDAKLGELKRSVGTAVKPRQDGRLEVNGVIVKEGDFSEAVMKTLLNDAKAAGLESPPLIKDEP